MKEVITITREQYREAVAKTAQKLAGSEKLQEAGGIATFLVPLTGMTFASDMEEILFADDQSTPKPHESATPDLFGGEYESDL